MPYGHGVSFRIIAGLSRGSCGLIVSVVANSGGGSTLQPLQHRGFAGPRGLHDGGGELFAIHLPNRVTAVADEHDRNMLGVQQGELFVFENVELDELSVDAFLAGQTREFTAHGLDHPTRIIAKVTAGLTNEGETNGIHPASLRAARVRRHVGDRTFNAAPGSASTKRAPSRSSTPFLPSVK